MRTEMPTELTQFRNSTVLLPDVRHGWYGPFAPRYTLALPLRATGLPAGRSSFALRNHCSLSWRPVGLPPIGSLLQCWRATSTASMRFLTFSFFMILVMRYFTAFSLT